MKTIWLDTIDSTNSEALRRLPELESGTVLAAREQTAGRGQRGNTWFTEPGKNLTFSIVLKFGEGGLPPLRATDAFWLNYVISVAVADFLQIPAFLCRQTDLLVACAATGRPVNVKKGQFLAPEDMAGVIGKLRAEGCNDILLTERGTTFGYHNLVVDMRSLAAMRALGVPVMFDATHSVQLPGGLGNASGGQRQYVPYLARAAAADALFLEVHPDPDHALSDGPNSLDFKSAEQTIEQVKAIHELTAQYL